MTSVTPGRASSEADPDVIDLLADLVAIDSVNPTLVPGGAGESAIADHCAGWLMGQGFEVHRLESTPGRPSVVGVLRGSGGGRSIMLNGHYDTVTLAGYDGDPLTLREDDGRLYGRGAYDMKGGVAAAMVAAVRAGRQGLRGDVLVACVADEEHSSLGTEEVLTRFSADAAIVTEPTGLELVRFHKGFVWFDVTVVGRAAHGSLPAVGIDAIARTGYLLVEIDRWAARLASGPAHPVLGPGSVHASIIRGGEEASSYPASCTITIERRTVPGETAETVETELVAMLDGIAETVPGFDYRIDRGLERHPFAQDAADPMVPFLSAQIATVTGRPTVEGHMAAWTDAALIRTAGIPCVLFGPAGAGAHSATEWTDRTSVLRVTEILAATIAEFCS